MPVPLADLVSAVLYGLQRELLRLPLEDAPERHAALIAWLQTLASLFPGARSSNPNPNPNPNPNLLRSSQARGTARR